MSRRLTLDSASPALTKGFKLEVINEHPVGLLPLQKFWEISRQIHEFMTWTQVECPFEKDKKIQSYLLTAPIYSEEGEGCLSMAARPPPHNVHITLTAPPPPHVHSLCSSWGRPQRQA